MKISTRYVKSRKSVYVVISHKSKESLYRLFALDPKYWNKKDRCVRSSHPAAADLNQEIIHALQTTAKIIHAYDYISAEEVGNHIKRHGLQMAPAYTESTIDFITREIENRNYDNAASFKTMRNWVTAFDPQVKITEWTKMKVEEFERFLRRQPSLKSENTISRYLTDLKTVLNRAVFLELLPYEANPFNRGYQIKSYKAKDIKLTAEELKKLSLLVEEDAGARFFMLMFYLDGARPNEALKLRWENISQTSVIYNQSKTGKVVQVTMTSQLAYILSLYNETGEYIVPNMNVSKLKNEKQRVASVLTIMNKALKVSCKKAGIQPVTCHIARHTFAFLADEAGYSLIELQHALNHSKPETTSQYIGKLRGDRMANKRKELHKLI